MSDVDTIRAEVVRVARELAARGLAVGTSGNVGARLADGRIAITPSSMEYAEMTPHDVVIVELDGSVVDGSRSPSSELPTHLAIFAARPDVAAIVHTHSPFATAFSVARQEVPAVHYVLALLVAPGRDTLRVAPYATFGTEELARHAVATLGSDQAILLANHRVSVFVAEYASGFASAKEAGVAVREAMPLAETLGYFVCSPSIDSATADRLTKAINGIFTDGLDRPLAAADGMDAKIYDRVRPPLSQASVQPTQ